MMLDFSGRLYGLSALLCQYWGICENTLKKAFCTWESIRVKEAEATMTIWSVLSVPR